MKKTDKKPTAQIYKFPVKDTWVTKDPKKVQGNLLEMKVNATEDAMDFLIPTLYEAMAMAGFKCDDELVNDVFAALLRGMMHEHFNIASPMVEFLYKYRKSLARIMEDQLTYDNYRTVEFD